MSRFDYVKYDDIANEQQIAFKKKAQELEALIDQLVGGRARSLAFTSLEETYMWIGKAIRDEQIDRGGRLQLQERRGE